MVPSALGMNGPANEAVGSALSRLAVAHGFVKLSGLAFQAGADTVMIDHALVDRFGVLIVTTQSCGGASLRGSDTDGRWTVRGADGSISTLVNPLQQNRQREQAVSSILAGAGVPLETDYIKSVVVFVDADLASLDLGPFDREKVVTLQRIEDPLRLRHDFAPNPGDIDPARVSALLGALRAADHSASLAQLQPGHIAVDHSATALADSAAMYAARRPTTQPLTVSKAPKRRWGRMLFNVGLRLAPVAIALSGFWWVYYGGGLNAIAARFDEVTVPEDQAWSVSAADPTAAQQGPDVHTAVKRLKQAAPPAVVNSIADVDRPQVSKASGGVTVYTWTYSQGSGSDREYFIRLAPDGRLVGLGGK